MLSRVANSIYWINRYVERAENYARFISVNLNLALDAPGIMTEQWRPLIIATADNSNYDALYDTVTRDNVIDFMTFDTRNPTLFIAAWLPPVKTPVQFERVSQKKCGET